MIRSHSGSCLRFISFSFTLAFWQPVSQCSRKRSQCGSYPHFSCLQFFPFPGQLPFPFSLFISQIFIFCIILIHGRELEALSVSQRSLFCIALRNVRAFATLSLSQCARTRSHFSSSLNSQRLVQGQILAAPFISHRSHTGRIFYLSTSHHYRSSLYFAAFVYAPGLRDVEILSMKSLLLIDS